MAKIVITIEDNLNSPLELNVTVDGLNESSTGFSLAKMVGEVVVESIPAANKKLKEHILQEVYTQLANS